MKTDQKPRWPGRFGPSSWTVVLAGSAGLAFVLAGAARSSDDSGPSSSVVPWTELRDGEALISIATRRAVVDGRTVHFPTPTRELAEALDAAGRAPGPNGLAALRHLAEARRELGDRPGAEKALEEWASRNGTEAPAAWAEAARWGARYRSFSFAFRCASKALPGLAEPARRELATERIRWAEIHPELADPLSLKGERAALFPKEPAFAEEWIRGLEEAGRLRDAEEALKGAASLPQERRVVLLAELKGRHGDAAGACAILEGFVGDPARHPAPETLRSFARRADEAARTKVEAWRFALERSFDWKAFLLLARYFEGKGRGDLAFQFLTQVERRHAAGFDRPAWLLASGLWDSIDAVPDAFRARLAAAAAGSTEERLEDLEALTRLALKAGGRPLAWGTYNDEAYRWAARLDVTPGFLTGGLSLLLTGFDRERSLAELEARRLPDRTFATAFLLVAELEKRAPKHPRLPSLHVAIMERHVERGEGDEALKLLPKADAGDAATRAEARRVALLAMRQTKTDPDREAALWGERLKLLAPDGETPSVDGGPPGLRKRRGVDLDEAGTPMYGRPASHETYGTVLREGVARLDTLDPSHRRSLSLLLAELDRLPKAESVWSWSVDQMAGWRLDEGLEARYRAALGRFEGPEWWNRLARWYARRQKKAELRALADDVVARFRVSGIFKRDPNLSETVPAEAQPNPYIFYGDYLRLIALERFPASPQILREAESRLILRSLFDNPRWNRPADWRQRGVVPDDLLRRRQDALLFEDAGRRSRFLDELVQKGRLETLLAALEALPARTPVEDVLLLDGWARLSRFERATPFADRLAEAYPGSGPFAQTAMTLHRSLSGLDPSHGPVVDRISRAVAPVLDDPAPVWTAVGETWQDLDRSEPASEAWRSILSTFPRDPARFLEVATIFWDYGRMAEALAVLESERTQLKRPRLHAFEAGVLREEVRDLPGAIDEYLAALRGEDDGGQGQWSWGEPRASERLARLVGRVRVQQILESRISGLKPGKPDDERALVSLLSLLALRPEPRVSWDDWMDLPRDPVGREERAERREAARPAEEEGLLRIGVALVAKTREMIPAATQTEFLAALKARRGQILDRRFAPDPALDVEFNDALLAREAALAPTEEKRIEAEIARAQFLAGCGRAAQATALWVSLGPRIDALPEGATKMHDLAAAARFAEETKGDAHGAWTALGRRYPWSLGVFEDRLAFLFRTGRPTEGLDLLEKTAAGAAKGHQERLTERLAKESLDRGDAPRARRALRALAAMTLDDDKRIAAGALETRLALRSGEKVDLLESGRKAATALAPERRADLWAAWAQAVSQEGRPAEAVDLAVESLNLRMDRGRLADACRLAAASGREKHLLGFFETQRARSPRDVRWVVAVREIRTFSGDLEGAIAASKEAVLIAPERESLQRETVALLERAGRFREAADFLEPWARRRAGDENVAAWRASLYVKAGDAATAAQTERASLAAWIADQHEQQRSPPALQIEQRRGRAARRFLALGRPQQAWDLAVPDGNLSRLHGVALSDGERTEIALRAGKLLDLVQALGSQREFRDQSAPVIARLAKPEQRDGLEAFLLDRIFPKARPPDDAELNRFWDFARDAGLHRFSEGVARRLLDSRRGQEAPWSLSPPIAFLQSLRPVVRKTPADPEEPWTFSKADFLPEWTAYLVSRDRLEALVPVLAPRVAEIDARVTGGTPQQKPLPFAGWFPVEAFARLAEKPGHSDWKARVVSWFRTPGPYLRFEAALGNRQDIKPLVDLLDDSTRASWLAFTAERKTAAAVRLDPVEIRRREAVTRVSSALSALVEGRPETVRSPDVVRLRGPRSVGEVLTPDPRWTWPEFAPRPAGESAEEAMAGRGADTGRLPGRLWGARPGDAWYVLEAISRWRERAPDAPWVPLESPHRGGETEKTLLAVRTAEGLGDLPLALSLDEEYFADLSRRDRLTRRLRLLVKADPATGHRTADDLLGREIRARQAKADLETWMAWQGLAGELSLKSPLEQLDASRPVSPPLLAYLWDAAPETAARFSPTDAAEFRLALATRWTAEGEALSREKTIRFLDDLWAVGSGAYPDRAARKLGPFWPAARDVLVPLDVRLRPQALAAVRSLPDPKPLREFAEKTLDRREVMELLLLRAELASGDDAAALARLDRTLSPTGPAVPLTWSPSGPARTVPAFSPAPEEGAEEIEAYAPPAPAPARAAEASRLVTWLRIFRDSRKAQAVPQAEEKLRVKVRKELDLGPAPVATWLLALELATSREALDAVLADLEKSWIRGEWSASTEDVALLTGALAPLDPPAATRWFARIDEPRTYAEARRRASLLAATKQNDAARAEWVAARARLAWSRTEERDAFDAWRRIPATPGASAKSAAPASWETAASFWLKKGPEFDTWGSTLAAHLSRHPYDLLSARVVLRSLAPAREAVVQPAAAALGGHDEIPAYRILRFERTRAFRAARTAVPSLRVHADDLKRRRYPRAEIDGLLADVARVAAEAGDSAALARSLTALQERNASGLAALKEEVATFSQKNLPRPDVTRTRAGAFAELRPRDLTWDVYARILNAENVP